MLSARKKEAAQEKVMGVGLSGEAMSEKRQAMQTLAVSPEVLRRAGLDMFEELQKGQHGGGH